MKTIFFTFICFISTLSVKAQSWVLQQSNTSARLNSVYFCNPEVGFAVGDNGTICCTTDGGANWVIQASGTSQNINAVYFFDGLTGFAVSNSELLKTTDGGNNWLIQDTMTNAYLSTITFSGIDTGYVMGNGKMLKTIDGGANWIKLSSPGGFYVETSYATDGETIYLGGESFISLKSSNGGIDWDLLSAPSSYGNIESIFFTNHDTGYFVGGGWAQGSTGSVFKKTTDGGISWTYPLQNINKWLLSIFFIDSTQGYMSSGDGSILKTINAGNNWTVLNSTVTTSLNSIFFANSMIGYSVGHSGVILKTTNGSIGLDEKLSQEVLSVFPNPTMDFLSINTSQEISEILIVDITGKLVMTKNQPSNTIHVADLSSGIYYILVTVGNNLLKQKFVKQ